MDSTLTLRVDGTTHHVRLDTRTSLLDALRQHLGVNSPKKGCDHGQCGACTVLVDGRRVLSCLALAVAHDGREVTTADGVPDAHPRGAAVHQAFLDNDAFQCGYCTPGQVCSAVGMLDELEEGWPSAVSPPLCEPELADVEIAERMSGNLCRCGAYKGIRAAVAQAGLKRTGKPQAPTEGGSR